MPGVPATSRPTTTSTRRVVDRSPVMADVAKLAGVSHITVSRVLNDHDNVRAETRERVLRAVDRLGYRRNVAARRLVTRRSETIGIVTFDTTLYGPAATVTAVERAARNAGYFVSIASVVEQAPDSVTSAVSVLVDQAVDGLVVVAPPQWALKLLPVSKDDVPLVVAGGDPESKLPTVEVDQVRGGREATAHLLGLGHETVWHVSGPEDWYDARARSLGWRQALLDAGRSVPPVAMATGDWSAASGFEAGTSLARNADLTAVFVANDQMALGLLLALHTAGRHVPRDVSVVGFDNVPESGYYQPPLTTISQDFHQLGARAMEALLQRINHETNPRAAGSVTPKLMVRASTALPRTR